jgi:hypothetical protein
MFSSIEKDIFPLRKRGVRGDLSNITILLLFDIQRFC